MVVEKPVLSLHAAFAFFLPICSQDKKKTEAFSGSRNTDRFKPVRYGTRGRGLTLKPRGGRGGAFAALARVLCVLRLPCVFARPHHARGWLLLLVERAFPRPAGKIHRPFFFVPCCSDVRLCPVPACHAAPNASPPGCHQTVSCLAL